jgi:hypothetical protein
MLTTFNAMPLLLTITAVLVAFTAAILVLASYRTIGPTQVGLVTRRFSRSQLSDDNPIAFEGEAGYQADLLMPGLRWKFCLLYRVEKFSWVQVPAGQIGVVIAQVGRALPTGAKSAVYRKEFGNFTDLETFIAQGGEKGVQRPVVPPGSLVPIHPVAFLVVTKAKVYGLPVSPELRALAPGKSHLTAEAFGLRPDQLDLVRIEPEPRSASGETLDTIGIVTTFEGDPLHSGDITSGSAGSPTSTPWRRKVWRTRISPRSSSEARTGSTTTTRTSRRSSTTAAASVSSTIRSSMAPMRSIRSSSASSASR